MWIHFTLRLVSTGMKRSEMRNRREVLKSKFLCSMIPCLSIAECMHQGDDVNVVIVFYLLRIIVGLLRRLPAGDSIRWPSSPRPRVLQVVRLKISRIITSSLAVIECSMWIFHAFHNCLRRIPLKIFAAHGSTGGS